MILITRPFKKSKLLVKQLDKQVCHIDPILSFVMRKKKINFNQYTDFIIASSESVSTLQKHYKDKINLLRRCNFYVIGSETEKSLKKLNFSKIKVIVNNSEQLIPHLRNLKKKNNKKCFICYLSGNIENTKFLKEIDRLRINYQREILYSVKSKKKLSNRTIRYLNEGRIKAVLLYSPFTARKYLELIDNVRLKKRVFNIKHICFSRNVASVLRQGGYKNVYSPHKVRTGAGFIRLIKTKLT